MMMMMVMRCDDDTELEGGRGGLAHLFPLLVEFCHEMHAMIGDQEMHQGEFILSVQSK